MLRSQGPRPDRGISPDLTDRTYAKRLGIAIAISLGLHEIVAGLWPRHARPPLAQAHVAEEVVTIVQRPRPTPAPTPAATPRVTPAPRYTLAPKIAVRAPAAKAAATPHAATGGAAAPKHLRRAPKAAGAAPVAAPVSVVAGAHLGQQQGGAGTGAGPGTGTSGLGGTGAGTGTSGNGNGGDTNSAPCGEVFLLPGRTDYKPDGTVFQHVYAKVILRNGDVELGTFPYPFVYGAEKLNPFVHDDQLTPDRGVAVQTPPPGADVRTMPAMVQFVLKYTSPTTGFSQLPDCNGTATSSPSPEPST